MLKNKFDKITNVFKAQSSTKTLSAGLFTAGAVGMVRAVSEIDISSLQVNSEDEVNKQDLISLYDYINKATQEENYNIYADNLDDVKSKILERKPKSISDSLAEKFRQDGWNITSNDGSSLLTVAIERIRERQKRNKDCDIQMAVSLILGMKKELITELENFADSNDKTLLHYLAESGREDILRFVIEKFNFNIKEAVKDRSGKTPLHYAAKFGKKKCFEALVENEAHFTSTINYKSELHYTAKSGNFILLEYLGEILKAKGIFDREKIKIDKYLNNALHYAAQSGNAECIGFCINNQVQFLKNQYNENPLHKIAGNAKIQDNAINFLIEHLRLLGRLKSEINRQDVDGNTPLHIAAQNGNKHLIKVFCELGTKIVKNKQGNTPLHIAIIHGNADCIELFHENIENSILKSKGEYGRDLVHLAAMYGKYDCLTFLLNKFPDCDLSTETRKGNMALHLALSSNTETELRKKCVSLLIDRSMQVNKSNNEGNTPLHFAAQLDLSFLSMIEKKLKEKKFDVYQEVLRENSNGNTVFHMAARVGNKSCLEHLFSLIQKGEIEEILDKKNENRQTLLHLSILSGRVECVKYLIKKSRIGIFPEQNTQKEFLFLAVLSSNKECLEFVAKELVDKKVAASIKVLCDENNNTLLHMAALADGVVCSQYIIESVSKSTIRKLFNTNNHKLTPLHLAAMTLNAEVIEYFMTDNYHYTEKMLNVVSKSDRTPLQYLVMHDNDFERILDEDFKQGQFLKKLVLEKRKQNEHLREKAIKALLYLTTIDRGQIINKKINFDIKDNKGKTFLKYALEYKNISILKLFLDSFYEIRENLKREYDKLELKYQEKSRKGLEFTTISILIFNVVYYSYISLNQQSKPIIEKVFNFIFMIFSTISLPFVLSNFMIGTKKEPIKRKIGSYTEKINRIEEVTGKLAKTIVEVPNSEGYNAILEQLAKNSEDILQVKSMLDKLMHAVSLESRDKLDISSQKMNRRGSTVLAERRSSSFLGNLGEKLDQYVRCNSRVQNIMDKLDNPSCVIAINEDSESKPKTPKNKFKNVATKLKRVSIFSKKKEDLIASSSLSEGANQENITRMNEENCRLIKRFGDTNEYLIFSTPFNPSGSTSREECGNNHSAARHVSYGSANNPVSDKEVSKSPSLILSNLEEGITVDCFEFERYRPRVYSSPSCIRKRAITARSLEYVILPDHIKRGK